MKSLFLYFYLCFSEMLNSLSWSFTSIYFFTNQSFSKHYIENLKLSNNLNHTKNGVNSFDPIVATFILVVFKTQACKVSSRLNTMGIQLSILSNMGVAFKRRVFSVDILYRHDRGFLFVSKATDDFYIFML